MNEPPPLTPNTTSPKNSGLAIWSLVLGILSLTCFGLFSGIPAVICGHKASSRIKVSGGATTGGGLALAGLITGYMGIAFSLFMIPLMLAIAIPNFVKARSATQKNACINNLRQIQGAKEMWALENKKTATETPTATDLYGATKYVRDEPTCPGGGTYSINAVETKPTCTVPGHQLEQF